ncbi:MAG: fatty acid CoA ligase family protein [Gemmatimonadetes bacterium]|nr:fatty acid CoA ligase family protein [Gemmatimonadota bacterium]
MPARDVNFAAGLTATATRRPGDVALVCPRPYADPTSARRYTYGQLEEESELLARGLREVGIGPGVRCAFLVIPGFDFFALAYALFKAGAVLVGVDPGMGRRNLGQCLDEAAPQALAGIPVVHALRRWFTPGNDTIQTRISTAQRTSVRSGLISLSTLRDLGRQSNTPLPTVAGQDPAIIAFTSGSTGPPKGVVFTHALLNAQLAAIRSCFGIEEQERDLVTFPHFAFFGPGLGVTMVLANMDFARPARAIPSWIVKSIRDHRVTNLFGSPALLRRVARYGTAHGVKLPTLRRVVSAGAPVPGHVVESITSMLDGGEFLTPYGATEALPVTCISGSEILTDTWPLTQEGQGVCVGKPVDNITVRIIGIADDAIETWSSDLEVPAGEIGEIAVSGPVASPSYYGRPDHTSLAKIQADGQFFHRMGDLGYIDADGRIWFCGRKSHRISTPDGDLYPVPIEAVFNTHPDVYRSALVAAGNRPVLCVQLERRAARLRWSTIRNELLELAQSRTSTAMVRDILRHDRFPVDRRHNAKIGREALSEWATRRLR